MGYELLGSRILAPFFGSSIYVWGGLISIFMAGLSCGYAIGGTLADKKSSFLTLSIIILISAIFIFPVSIYGRVISEYFSSLPIDIKYSALFASFALFFIPCCCLGIVSPYLVGLANKGKQEKIKKVGFVYAVSTIGSILGTLFVSFYLIAIVTTSTGIMLLVIPLIICISLAVVFFFLDQG